MKWEQSWINAIQHIVQDKFKHSYAHNISTDEAEEPADNSDEIHVTLWKFQSLDEVKTLVYMEVYILNRLVSLEESFILNIVED